jgi:polyribonucleotide nucleotidyltransferase
MAESQASQERFAVGSREIVMETGKLAGQADGSVVVTCEGTTVLVTAVGSKHEVDRDFFPLTIDVEERMYAAGKIPGGFFRREGRPSEKSTLAARLTDRPLRPNFPEGMRIEVQVVVTILSVDLKNPPDVLGLLGASTALTISDIPFNGPVGAVRIGRGPEGFIVNPTFQELADSDMNLVVAGVLNREDNQVDVIMVEAEADQVPEDDIVDAMEFSKQYIMDTIRAQLRLQERVGRPKREVNLKVADLQGVERLAPQLGEKIWETVRECAREQLSKQEREDRLARLRDEAMELHLAEGEASEVSAEDIKAYFDEKVGEALRRLLLEEELRVDGRRPEEIRPISCEVGLVSRTHGSGLFTRGQTQVLTILTLGAIGDVQTIDDISIDETKRYMHHYNFPPFSVGETGRIGSPRRREIGHGALAERALLPLIPPEEEFPYAIRLVSEVLSSNGSTSMASVCGSTLALMDAGVPLKDSKGVAGIAMGLIKEDGRVLVLSDIQGIEDKYGDMDFKVAGTRDGVTALQMDLKTRGVSVETLQAALAQAREGRLYILRKMEEVIDRPRTELSPYAPRVITLEVPVDKIKDVIGSGGKTIHRIIADFDVDVDIEDDGRIFITAKDMESGRGAKEMIEQITREVSPGDQFTGTVTRIMSFGAFVEYLPGREGLVHISKLSNSRIARVEDVVKVGDRVRVEVDEIDKMGRVNLFAIDYYNPAHRQQGPQREEGGAPRHNQPRRPEGRDNRDRGRDSRPQGGHRDREGRRPDGGSR